MGNMGLDGRQSHRPQAQIDPGGAPMGVRLSSAVPMNSFLTVDRLNLME